MRAAPSHLRVVTENLQSVSQVKTSLVTSSYHRLDEPGSSRDRAMAVKGQGDTTRLTSGPDSSSSGVVDSRKGLITLATPAACER